LTPLPLTSLLPIVIVASLSAPLLALILAVAAPNKVAGFAVVKVLNAVNLLPIVAYFVPRPVQFAAGIFPTYWPMRALWSAAVGEVYGAYLVLGGVVSVLALLLAVRLCDTGDGSPTFGRSQSTAACDTRLAPASNVWSIGSANGSPSERPR
jgi:hypothetical protein